MPRTSTKSKSKKQSQQQSQTPLEASLSFESLQHPKFRVNRRALLTKLDAVSKAVSGRPSMPILGNVLLVVDADEQTLRLTAYDDVTLLKTSISDIESTQSFSTAVPQKLWFDLLDKALKRDVEIGVAYIVDDASEELKLVGFDSGSEFRIRCLNSQDYPVLDNLPEPISSIATDVLFATLKSVAYASSTEEDKQILQGVRFTFKSDDEQPMLEMAATDGHRLACNVCDCSAAPSTLDRFIPKAVALDRMTKLFDDAELIDIGFDRVWATFRVDDSFAAIRLLDGDYPNVGMLIPAQFRLVVQADRRQLLDACKESMIVASIGLGILKVWVKRSKIEVRAEAAEVGDAVVTCPIERLPLVDPEMGCDGNGREIEHLVEVGFNGKYLIEALETIASTTVTLSINTSTSPVVLSGVDASDETHLVMPVQIRR